MDHKETNILNRKKKAKSRMNHLRRLQKAYNKRKYNDFTQLLLKKLKIAMEALDSIADKDYDQHNQYSFWVATSHEAVAEAVANDTKLARKTLKEFDDIRGIVQSEKRNRNHYKRGIGRGT